MSYRFILIVFTLLSLFAVPLQANRSPTAPVVTVETGFSPDGSAEKLILNTISNAQKSIQVAAYSFTSQHIANALINAQKRGVDVRVVIDYKQSVQLDRTGKGIPALNLLVNAKVPIKALDTRNIQHSKYMIIDDLHVQTGSYNYTIAAALHNHENVIIIRNNAELAKTYQNNWQMLYNTATVYR